METVLIVLYRNIMKNKIINITLVLTLAFGLTITFLMRDFIDSELKVEMFNVSDELEQVLRLHYEDINHATNDSIGINQFDLEIIKSDFAYEAIISSPTSSLFSLMSEKDNVGKLGVYLIVIDEEFLEIMEYSELEEGTFFEKEDFNSNELGIVISESLENLMFNVDTNPIGKNIDIESQSYLIKGVVKKGAINYILGSLTDEFILVTQNQYELIKDNNSELLYNEFLCKLKNNEEHSDFSEQFYNASEDLLMSIGSINLSRYYQSYYSLVESNIANDKLQNYVLSCITYFGFIVSIISILFLLEANQNLNLKTSRMKKLLGITQKIIFIESMIQYVLLSILGGAFSWINIILLKRISYVTWSELYKNINIPNLAYVFLVSIIIGIILASYNNIRIILENKNLVDVRI